MSLWVLQELKITLTTLVVDRSRISTLLKLAQVFNDLPSLEVLVCSTWLHHSIYHIASSEHVYLLLKSHVFDFALFINH